MAHTECTINIQTIVQHKGGFLITYKEDGKRYEIFARLETEAALAVGDDNFITMYYIIDTNSIKELK